MVSPVAARFAANLRVLRDRAGLTQEELAFRADVHRTQVSLMEGGERLPRFETLVRLIGALGVDHGALFAGIAWQPPDLVRGGLLVTPVEADDDAPEEA
ncbi:MAG: helix-turn-helix transcriptional regulator [Actinobacteria bacterium]|nr:helix-turn-helix transcriptional regulator [Actinomycetota bacterium]